MDSGEYDECDYGVPYYETSKDRDAVLKEVTTMLVMRIRNI